MEKAIVSLKDIKISNKFKKTEPSKRKIRMCRKFYQKYGKVDRDIVVNKDMYLVDGYVAYKVLSNVMGLEDVEVVVSEEPISNREVYVFAKLKNSDSECVYKMLSNDPKIDNVNIGDLVIVDTPSGPEIAIVTKVCPNLLVNTLYCRYVVSSKGLGE